MGGGCSRQVKLTNSSLTCTHSLLLKTQGTSQQTGPLRTCPVVLHRFVDICPYNRATGTFKYSATRYLCRREGGGGAGKGCQGAAFHTRWGGGAAAPPPPPPPPPPKAMLDPGLSVADTTGVAAVQREENVFGFAARFRQPIVQDASGNQGAIRAIEVGRSESCHENFGPGENWSGRTNLGRQGIGSEAYVEKD